MFTVDTLEKFKKFKDAIYATANYSEKGDPYYFIQDKNCVIGFFYKDDTKLEDKALKSCYTAQIAFINSDWKEDVAQEIVNFLFGDDVHKVWEEISKKNEKRVTFHWYYLFVSAAYGKKAIQLPVEAQEELIARKMVLANPVQVEEGK